MPRRARIALPGVPLHLIQRGNNRQVCFFAEDDCHFYLDWLAEHAPRCGCHLHAWVLMSNHVHLLLTPVAEDSAGQLMKALGQRYVQYVNRTYRRSGSLWEGRFRSCIAGEEVYVLGCQRYIELNPVRAGMVEHPAEYPWSSYRANARGEAGRVLLTPHPLYLALGLNDGERQATSRELFRHELEPGMVDEIRRATNGNFALGSPAFQDQVTSMLGRRASRMQPGRPRREAGPESGNLF